MNVKLFVASTLLTAAVAANSFATTLVFQESMGTVGGTTSFVNHTTNEGWDTEGLSFSGTGDVRATGSSSGYEGASGAANIWLASGGTREFIIGGIDLSAYDPALGFNLSFGAQKNAGTTTSQPYSLSYSSDGGVWLDIVTDALVGGGGSWSLVELSGLALPSSESLSLRWINTVSNQGLRIDDVTLTAIPEPSSYAALFGLAALGWLFVRSRRNR